MPITVPLLGKRPPPKLTCKKMYNKLGTCGLESVAGLRPLVPNKKIFFLFLNQNICCRCSKELSQLDGSIEHPKHMLKMMGMKIFTLFAEKFCLLKPVSGLSNQFAANFIKIYQEMKKLYASEVSIISFMEAAIFVCL